MIKGGAVFSLTLLAAGTTIVWSAMVGRQEGLLAPARDGL
jgi:hypothetical protein